MRNMAIYQDKVFVATTDARLVALDARTGKKLWDTPIADRAKGYANTAGPMVMKGVVVNGLVGCDRYGNDGCWISGYDAATGKQLWKFNTVRRGTGAGRRDVGQARRQPPHRRRNLDRRQLRSGSRPDLLGRGAGEAVDAREPRHFELRQRAVHELDRRAAAEGRHAGVALPARARRVARSRRSVRARAGRHRRSEGRVHDRQTGHSLEARSPHRQLPRLQGNHLPERLRVDRSEDRHAALSRGHPRAADRPVGRLVPEHRRRPQLAGDELSCRPAACSIIPLSQSCMEMYGAQAGIHERVGRHRCGPPLLRDAGQRRQRRQARRLRREDDEGSLEPGTARRRFSPA